MKCFYNFFMLFIIITLIISSFCDATNRLLTAVLQPPSSIENDVYNVFLNESNFWSFFPNNAQFEEKSEVNWKLERSVNEIQVSDEEKEEEYRRNGKICSKNIAKCMKEDARYVDTLKHLQRQIFTLNSPLDLSSIQGIRPKCQLHSYQYIRALNQFKFWAIKMYDANAKLPSGFLNGNVNQYGDFDLCMQVSSDDLNIQGQYCLASMQVKTPPNSYISALLNLIQSHYIFKSKISDPGHRVPRFSSMQWALCVPSSCTAKDVQIGLAKSLNSILNRTNISFDLEVDPAMCHKQNYNSLPYSTVLVSAFFICVVFVALLATFCDYFELQSSELLLAFSLIKATEKLFSMRRQADDIQAVHGIRFINALCLLGAHKSMAIFFIPFVNRTELSESLGKQWSILGRAASLYTDPFIMISGTLTTYSLLNKLQRGKKIYFLEEYCSRLLRIVPPLGAVMLFCTFVFPWIGSGPQWNLVVSHHALNCKKYWWRNILFIHNYFGFTDMCLTHTHHVGIDMQLFFCCLLVIPLLWKWPKQSLLALLLVAVASTFMRYYVTFTQNLSNFVHFGTSIEQLFSTADNMYILPPHRATVYIMGIFLGYILKNNNYCLNSLFVGNILAVAFFCISFWGPSFMGLIDYVYNPLHAAWYAAFAPILWCASFAWIIFTTHNNQTGFVGRIMSWKGFLIATRLSYAVYLTQFPLYFYNVGTTRSPEYYSFSKFINLLEYGSILLASIVLTVLFDLPFQQIKQVLQRKTYKEQHSKQKFK